MKKIAQIILNLSTKITLRRNKYNVVAITGSVGKTSTKKAVSLVLREKYKVLSFEEEGYNTEIGLPLILLEEKIPKSKFGWLKLIIISPFVALKKRDYDYAVLEMGADRPGDIEYLTSLAKPDIAIITNVSGVHLENFGTVEDIAKEKEKILSALTNGGTAIINIDSDFISKITVPTGIKKLTFGKHSNDIKIIKQDFQADGSKNYLKVYGKDLILNSVALGEHILYIFAAAVAVGISEKVETNVISAGLEKYTPVRGRLNIIKGVNGSILIDDSYNASPESMKNALDILEKFLGKKKIAVLGTMGELGIEEKRAHEEIGSYLTGKCDILVTVGDVAKKHLAKSALAAGFPRENVFSFHDSSSAGKYLKGILKSKDVVLLKGSQNAARMEKAVKEIMKEPGKASVLLCRQGKEWRKR